MALSWSDLGASRIDGGAIAATIAWQRHGDVGDEPAGRGGEQQNPVGKLDGLAQIVSDQQNAAGQFAPE